MSQQLIDLSTRLEEESKELGFRRTLSRIDRLNEFTQLGNRDSKEYQFEMEINVSTGSTGRRFEGTYGIRSNDGASRILP